jgi:hypothetical protein
MTLYVEDFEIGQRCPLTAADNEADQCAGVLMLSAAVDCSCHIAAPCAGCTEALLVCTVCGWGAEDLDND